MKKKSAVATSTSIRAMKVVSKRTIFEEKIAMIIINGKKTTRRTQEAWVDLLT
ncbi:hypothetical protein FH972_024738 [Carpinus fangiana]|uniref:Uncharacterized protein n=1 Tax=Carpinus fangiana TaxID=176857 RepID=A0A5N6KZB2_9ROSI|nr:hypothetical protein FH972_024738 [Carpinus fangiana]